MAKRKKCPNMGELKNFIQYELLNSKIEEIREHLKKCDECRDRSARLTTEFILKSAGKNKRGR